MSDWRIECGDALDLLEKIEPETAQAIVTDPPYCSGARHTVQIRNAKIRRSDGAQLDSNQMTSVGLVWLIRAVAIQARRILKPGGSFLCFTDWRQYPNVYGALESADLRIQNMVVWDKVAIGMGNGFRNRHELIIHASRGTPTIYDRSVPSVLVCDAERDAEHPTKKPEPLMRELIRVVAQRGDLVVDPFAGQGSTGVACQRLGCRFLGIDRDLAWCVRARRDMVDAELPLFEM